MAKKRAPANRGSEILVVCRDEETAQQTSERVATDTVREPGQPAMVPLAFLADLPEETIQLPDFPIKVQGSGVGFYTHCENGYKFVIREMTPRQKAMVYR